ncbi:MAG: DUF998 domain-containing protein [Solirubrobacteraceae bacterium]
MHASAVVSLVALAVVIGALVWLHLVPSGLSPVRNAVSHYGITRFSVGYRVATIAFAISGIALAIALSDATNGRAGVTIALLALFALARALISWFPMDAPGTERTGTGQAHGLLAIAAFGSAAAAALKLAHVLADGGPLHGLAGASKILGWLMVACLVGQVLARGMPALRARFGLVERGFYLSAIVWFAVIAIGCLAAS